MQTSELAVIQLAQHFPALRQVEWLFRYIGLVAHTPEGPLSEQVLINRLFEAGTSTLIGQMWVRFIQDGFVTLLLAEDLRQRLFQEAEPQLLDVTVLNPEIYAYQYGRQHLDGIYLHQSQDKIVYVPRSGIVYHEEWSPTGRPCSQAMIFGAENISLAAALAQPEGGIFYDLVYHTLGTVTGIPHEFLQGQRFQVNPERGEVLLRRMVEEMMIPVSAAFLRSIERDLLSDTTVKLRLDLTHLRDMDLLALWQSAPDIL